MADSLVEAFIHGETLTAVVQRVAKLCPLLADGRSVFFFPFPGSLHEFFTADIIAGNAFALESGINSCLGCNAGMIHARQIQHVVSLHPLVAGDNVLQRVVPGMADMQNTGHIRGRDDNGKGILGLITGSEVSLLDPFIITAVFDCLMIILCIKILLHSSSCNKTKSVCSARTQTLAWYHLSLLLKMHNVHDTVLLTDLFSSTAAGGLHEGGYLLAPAADSLLIRWHHYSFRQLPCSDCNITRLKIQR